MLLAAAGLHVAAFLLIDHSFVPNLYTVQALFLYILQNLLPLLAPAFYFESTGWRNGLPQGPTSV